MVFEPVLRSPSFPGTPVATAAVSRARPPSPSRADLTAAEIERARHIAEQIAAERIGGRFWASDRSDPWKAIGGDGPVAVSGDDEAGLLGWIAGAEIEW